MPNELTDTKTRVLAAIELHSQGRTLPEAAREMGLDVRTIQNTVRSDNNVAQLFAEAGEACASHLVTETLRIADNDVDPARSRVRVSARQWVASRLDRNRWGDKVEVKLDQTVSITAALQAAEARLQPISDQVRTLDAEFVDISAQNPNEPTDNKSVGELAGLPNPFD